MFNFGFENAKVDVIVKAVRTSHKYEDPTNPEHIRVYGNGVVIMGDDFIAKHNLEFVAKGDESTVCNGMDIFRSSKWSQLSPLNQEAILATVVSKTLGKLNAPGRCTYNAEGKPNRNVKAAQFGSYGAEFAHLVQEVYGIKLAKDDYVDLALVVTPLAVENGIYNIPKVFTTGKDKGKDTYERRENVSIYAFVPEEESFKLALEKTAKYNADLEMTQAVTPVVESAPVQEEQVQNAVQEEVAPVVTPNEPVAPAAQVAPTAPVMEQPVAPQVEAPAQEATEEYVSSPAINPNFQPPRF